MRYIIDGHNDTMTKAIDEKTLLPKVDIGKKTDFHLDIEKIEKGKLSALAFASFCPGFKSKRKSLNQTLAILNCLYWNIDKNDELKVINNINEIKKNSLKEKISVIPTIEGAYFFTEENYIELLKQFKDLNIKLIGFNWNYSNNLGEGVEEKYPEEKIKSNTGLTDLGKKVLKEMEKLGIGIDVSHMNERTFKDIVNNYSGPIIASHSNAYNLMEHRRNLKDWQLEKIKESNGVVGAVLSKGFIKEGEATISDFVDHIDYMKNLIGVDHIGIGSDFDGTTLPVDLKDGSEFYKIEEELKNRNYTEEEIDKILGGNFYRVFKDIENLSNFKRINTLDLKVEILNNKIIIKNLKEIKDLKYKIIKNGILIEEDNLKGKNTLKLNLKDEGFSLITLEILKKDIIIARKTKIIHNKLEK